MNIYETEAIRKRYKISWAEEYLLGMVSSNEQMLTKDILECASKGVMSLATTHKYLSGLLEQGYVKRTYSKEDRRLAIISLTKRGKDFIKEVSHVAS